MTDVGELIAVNVLVDEFKEDCPFKEEMESGPEPPAENVGDDDLPSNELPANNGGVLGENLEGRKPGDASGGPFPPSDYLVKLKARDTERGGKLLHMDPYKDAKKGDFPFTVAAHHLIPGNASLYKKDAKLINYMKHEGKVTTQVKKRKVTIEGNLGYDVNGSHNGVWLPGNYAIKTALPKRKTKDGRVLPPRKGTTPVKDWSWADLGDGYEEWQFAYVAGACKAGRGQFHDSHEEPYSSTVKLNLMNVVTALSKHLETQCPKCKEKDKVPPPFRIKEHLYGLSQALRDMVRGPPGGWKVPWFTSEKWSKVYFKNGKLTDAFDEAYRDAVIVRPENARRD